MVTERKPRRLKARPEALAAVMAAHRKPVEPELEQAKISRLLDLLDAMERMVARIGGFMTAADQDLMREVREQLVESGKRVDERPLWTDRR